VPITLQVGSDSANNIQIDNLTDLRSEATTLLSLGEEVVGDLNQAVSKLATDKQMQLKYASGNNQWTVGNFTFGLSGGVTGSISFKAPGDDLLTYTKSFPTTIGDGLGEQTNADSTGKISVQTGQYFLLLELDMTLAANAAAKVNLGSVGISGSVGTSDTFAIRFAKSVGGDISVKDALVAAFQGFVLPLHPNTYGHLQVGDYLYHQFNATLNLGFGATLGLDKVFFSGQYKADIPSVPAAPSVSSSGKIEVKLGATLGATFKYTDSFEAMLWKTDAEVGRLHLYRNKTTDSNFNVGATVAIIADPKVSISAVSVSSLATTVLPGGTGAVVSSVLAAKAQPEVSKWVNDVQGKINNWLQPFQEGKTSLQWAIERTNASFLLTDFTFDLSNGAFPAAWSAAVAGDFAAVLAIPNARVSLDPGSGLEGFHTKKSAITFNLFGKFAAEWDNATIDNYSIIYAGNNTFHLVEDIGRQAISAVNGHGKEIDLYFAAAATSDTAGVKLDDVNLHAILKATRNSSFGNAIAGMLSKATTGTDASALIKQVLASAQNGKSTESLEIVFKPSAYGKLSFSALSNGRPVDEAKDQANYQCFAAACSQLESSSPANFSIQRPLDLDYLHWRIWNIAATDDYPPRSGSVPNRHDLGDWLGSKVEACIDAEISAGLTWQQVSYAFRAASDFMNLCEDLSNLAKVTESPTAPTWRSLVTDLNAIVNNDLQVDFLGPMALALAMSLGQKGTQPSILGPAPNTAQESAIVVTLTYT
jgi:hypothetical protein